MTPDTLCAICLTIVFVMAGTELHMGRKVGKLVMFAPNSRGIIDVYSMSHVIHGFIFYYFFSNFVYFPWVVILAVVAECIWEIFENTPYVINRYRKTVSIDYQGDTIINSLSDVFVMLVGVFVAGMLPIWGIISLIVMFEFIALYLVRDNLLLNIIMLLYPFESIKQWQLRKNK